ncbi:hypothetical protein GUITHDRAFT_103138 [Guillardia theta CCMP2712]|uniref:Uncharacterized protein n=1 Tax=Guillardia theta (strain CCMP2712) TaxID=905079 RepID=L1JSE0_GUITC|nr:hypothetical protein GUITHDRAFT_103138 [Guillardia theta CCMP2712]EKX51219.1 hypothetical protein GUITHDRAFT_103138 [Guillardia theta CCMP2712]|eukprot:XP_005838199.1 hypothetical protein GUITHDRAFT_103138 [Guillardia theta CCMP2712]
MAEGSSTAGMTKKEKERQEIMLAAGRASSTSFALFLNSLSKKMPCPYIMLPAVKDAISAAMEVPCIEICHQFVLSISELIAVVRYGSSIRIPRSLGNEQDFFIKFRSLCRERMHPLVHDFTPESPVYSTMKKLVMSMPRLPDLKEEYVRFTVDTLGASLSAAQRDSLLLLAHHVKVIEQNTRKGFDQSAKEMRIKKQAADLHPDFSCPLGIRSKTKEGAGKDEEECLSNLLDTETIQRINMLRTRDRKMAVEKLIKELISHIYQSKMKENEDKKKMRPQTARPDLKSSREMFQSHGTANSFTQLGKNKASQRRITVPVDRQVVNMWYQSKGLYHTPYESLSGKELASGNSPQYWLDPETNVYRLVPSYPTVGRHPMLRTSRPKSAVVHQDTARFNKEERIEPAPTKNVVRDEIEKLTMGRLKSTRRELEIFERAKTATHRKMQQADEAIHTLRKKLNKKRGLSIPSTPRGPTSVASPRSERVATPTLVKSPHRPITAPRPVGASSSSPAAHDSFFKSPRVISPINLPP